MITHYKTAVLQAVPTTEAGTFTALASTGHVDRDNERFGPNAWDQTVAEWRSYSDFPPLMYNHSANDPGLILGRVTSMQAIPSGLLIEGRLDLTNPKAESAYRAMRAGTLTQLSVGFAYREVHEEGDVLVIDRADLIEVSLTPVPANPNARILDVKSLRMGCGCTSLEARCDLHRKAVPAARAPRPVPADVLAYKAQIDALAKDAGPRVPPDEVDAWLAADRAERQRAAAEEQRMRDLVREIDERAVLRRDITQADIDERERDARARDLAEVNRRAAERDAEREQAERADAARRQAALEDPLHYYQP